MQKNFNINTSSQCSNGIPSIQEADSYNTSGLGFPVPFQKIAITHSFCSSPYKLQKSGIFLFQSWWSKEALHIQYAPPHSNSCDLEVTTCSSPPISSTLLPLPALVWQHTLTHLIQLSVSSSESLEIVRGRYLSKLSLTHEEARAPSDSTKLAITSAIRPEPSTTTQGILLLMATLID